MAAAGSDADPGFLRTEREVLGQSLSRSWRSTDLVRPAVFAQIGGQGADQPDEFGGSAPEEQKQETDDGPSNTGDKFKAGGLSLLVPGTGQFYNGDNKKGYIMLGVEVGIWTAYFVFDAQGDNSMESAQEWASIYAGTSGSHPESYWQAVGRYGDSDTFEDYQRREARATGVPLPPRLPESDRWQWVNDDRQAGYSEFRADGNSAYDRRDFMILFAVVNRAVSVVDAVMGAGDKPGVLETSVMGMDVEMAMLPSWRDPGASLTVSRGF